MHYRETLELDLDIDACGEVETHERVDGRGRGVEDVDEALVSAHLELLTGILVLVRRTDDRIEGTLGGQGDGAGNTGARLLCSVHDELRGLINYLVIIALEADPDLLA